MKQKGFQELYNSFGSEKVIVGIKNPYFSITFMKSYLWAIPFLFIFGIIYNRPLFKEFENTFLGNIINIIIPLILILLSIYGFLSSVYTIYFDNNTIVLENKLGKRKIIDINRYPRIFFKHTLHTETKYDEYRNYSETVHSYYLHIQQGNTDIIFDKINSEKLKLFIASLDIKEKGEVSEIQWSSSVSDKEYNFENYILFLNKQEKIIGVKDSTLKMKIENNSGLYKKFKICAFIMIISFILCAETSFNLFLSNIFMYMGIFASFIDFFFIIRMLENGKDNNLKISYPLDGQIKINSYLLDYKNNNVMIRISKKRSLQSDDKYVYTLLISGQYNTYHIDLNMNQEKQLGDFIDNLVFKEKEK